MLNAVMLNVVAPVKRFIALAPGQFKKPDIVSLKERHESLPRICNDPVVAPKNLPSFKTASEGQE